MKYTKQCECCGHQVSAFSHSLNSQLVKALEQLRNFYYQNHKGCNLQKNLDLTKNQYNNFQKLQYFNLAVRKDDGWYPTQAGVQFLEGDITIEMPVATFGREILRSYHEAWDTAKTRPRLVHISQIKNYSWKKREDYQEEKSNTLF